MLHKKMETRTPTTGKWPAAIVLGPRIIMLSLSASCTSGGSDRRGALKEVPVTVASAAQKNIPVQLFAIGNVEAYATVAVKAQAGGELMQVNFKEGDFIKEGDLLFVLDSRPYEAAVRQAEANLARNTAQAKNAFLQEKRYASLLKEGAASPEQYDLAKSSSDALEAAVRADRAALENARIQLSYCTIRAPLSGQTGTLKVDRGNIVKANDTSPLVIINQISPIYVTFSVAEKYFPEIKKYMASGPLKVEAAVPKSDLQPAEGVLSFIDSAVDTTTGTILLKAAFPNEAHVLWPGQFVNAALTLTAQPDAVVIPSQAVQAGQAGTYVFVVTADLTAELRAVTAGRAFGQEVVIEKGVQPGEQVVTDGQLQLVAGAKVEIKK